MVLIFPWVSNSSNSYANLFKTVSIVPVMMGTIVSFTHSSPVDSTEECMAAVLNTLEIAAVISIEMEMG